MAALPGLWVVMMDFVSRLAKSPIIAFLMAAVLLLVSARAGLGVYRRVRSEVMLRVTPPLVSVEGTITEALVEERPDPLLPFTVRAHVVRYSFPAPPGGTTLTGEQVVTARTFARLGEQGAPVEVTMSRADPRINAVDPRLAFPASAGWWLAVALLSGGGALIAAMRGTLQLNSRARHAA